jgi:hypothetical protein
MRWIAENMDAMEACKVQEGLGVVGIVAIDDQKASLPFRFSFRLLMKVLDIVDIYLAVDPALLRITETSSRSK